MMHALWSDVPGKTFLRINPLRNSPSVLRCEKIQIWTVHPAWRFGLLFDLGVIQIFAVELCQGHLPFADTDGARSVLVLR
jgi:hypothetical protein